MLTAIIVGMLRVLAAPKREIHAIEQGGAAAGSAQKVAGGHQRKRPPGSVAKPGASKVPKQAW